MITRRNFIKKTALTSAAASLTAASWSRVRGANEQIRVGVVGFNSKGSQHIKVFHGLDNVRVVALADADQAVIDREEAKFKERGESVKTFQDMRQLYDQKDVDVVAIATPNHWHTLAAIWAMQAGKDVYVEKPVSHNVWEGRRLVDAARKYDRIVQSGMQNRSDVGMRAFKEYLDSGAIGKVKWVHGLWFKRRKSIGKVPGPQHIPDSVDYNMWTGPVVLEPLMRERLHYDWHWHWNTGDGDMANIGVHQIDDCRFLADLKGLPKRVISFGQRWGYKDDGETPNVHVALFEYDIPLIVEVRGLPMQKGIKAMDHVKGVRAGDIIMCEKGYFAGGRGGGWVYDLDGNKVKQFPGDGGGTHQQNFIDAVRSRDRSILHSEVEEGHFSATVCHLANISYRIGQDSTFDQIKSAVQYNPQTLQRAENMQQLLAKNEVDLQAVPAKLGADLQFDPQKENFTGDWSYEANMFLSRTYRKPFVVPEKF